MSTSAGNGNPGRTLMPHDADVTTGAQHNDQSEKGKCGLTVKSVSNDDHTSVSSDKQVAQEKLSQRTGGNDAVSLDQGVQSAIGRQLRTMYDEIVQAPVPERFEQLLAELEKHQKRR
jgi:hypothetical protein